MDNAQYVANLLVHHGIRGMRWGIRRRNPSGTNAVSVDIKNTSVGTIIKTKGGEHLPAHPDAVAARVINQKIKKSGKSSVSNEELQKLATRIDLEQRVSRLRESEISPGQKFAKELLTNIAKQQITRIANDTVSKQVGGFLEGKKET